MTQKGLQATNTLAYLSGGFLDEEKSLMQLAPFCQFYQVFSPQKATDFFDINLLTLFCQLDSFITLQYFVESTKTV